MASLVPYSTSTSPLVSLFYSLSFDTYHNYSHIFIHLLLLLATSNSLLPTPLSSTFHHVLLLAYCGVTRLSIPSILHSLTHTPFNTKLSSICHSSPLNTFTSTFFISSTILITSIFSPNCFYFFYYFYFKSFYYYFN